MLFTYPVTREVQLLMFFVTFLCAVYASSFFRFEMRYLVNYVRIYIALAVRHWLHTAQSHMTSWEVYSGKICTETGFWLSFFGFLLLIIRTWRKTCSNAIVYRISHAKLPGPPNRKIFQMQEQASVNMGGFPLVPSVYYISFKSYVYVLELSQIYSAITLYFRWHQFEI